MGGWINAIIPMLIVPYYCVIGGWVAKYLYECLTGQDAALAVITAIYSVTRPGAMEGVKYLLIPNLDNFSIMTIVAAMGQMFYSLSIAMGVLYTYGSYLKKDVDMEKSTTQLEIFDTAIALLAGLMIIPAVFAFSGGNTETLQAGPSLMFITIPKVFDSMGMGNIVGSIFFLMVYGISFRYLACPF